MVTARQFLDDTARDQVGRLRLRYWRGEFWLHDGRRYQPFAIEDLRARLVAHMDGTGIVHIGKGVVSNVVECIQSNTSVLRSRNQPCWLSGSTPGDVLAMQIGLIDVEQLLAGTPKVVPHSPEWFSVICLPYPFDASAECPTWSRVVGENLEGDADRIALVQEWFGYCLVHDTKQQKFVLMYGEGGTGKSTTCAVLRALLGDDNVSAVPLEAFGERFRLNQTIGKLANISAEIGEIDKVAEGNLKSFTSGDLMQFERKFRDPVEIPPTARLVLATNNLPRFSDRSGGLWRRMILVPFDHVIPPERRVKGMDDPTWWLKSGELPGVFNWAVEGLRRLRQRGDFTKSKAVNDAVEDYRIENNPARQFLVENYREHPNGQVVTAEVYKAYATWCGENGYRALASRTFSKEIVRTFPSAERRRITDFGGVRTWAYTGICEGADT